MYIQNTGYNGYVEVAKLNFNLLRKRYCGVETQQENYRINRPTFSHFQTVQYYAFARGIPLTNYERR